MPGIMTEMIVFTGERLDRAAERRSDPEWVAAQAASPTRAPCWPATPGST